MIRNINTNTKPKPDGTADRHDEWVQPMMQRFLDGQTTVDEEQLLAGYFRRTDDVPDEWKPYRDMFAYIDGGMPIGQLPDFDGTADGPDSCGNEAGPQPERLAAASSGRSRRKLVWMCGVAVAAAALLVVAGIGSRRQADIVATLPAYRPVAVATDSAGLQDSEAASGTPEAKPTPDAFGRPSQIPAEGKRRTRARRPRYDIAPPKTYYAAVPQAAKTVLADSVQTGMAGHDAAEQMLIAAEQQRLAEENRQIEKEIQESLMLVDEVRELLMANDNEAEEEEKY